MKRMLRRKRTWAVILLLLLLAPVIYSYVMMSEFAWSEKELQEFFEGKKMKPVYDTMDIKGRKIFYASAGADTLPMVLFIHGAPGSWYDYVRFFGDENLISRAHLVALDRPGYGKSGVGNYMTSITGQAETAAALLSLNHSGRPALLVGHSYGGPIAARLAMMEPERVIGLMLLAPAIDPDQEKQFAINRLASWKPVQSLMPKMLLAAYYEKKTHADELRRMDSDWHLITAPTCYMYGEKDGLVPPGNVAYARRKLVNAPLEVVAWPKEDHFIPWTQRDSVTKVILKMIEASPVHASFP